MCTKSVERSHMSSLAEAQSLVQHIAGERGSAKERIRRAALRLPKFTFNRVRELFYGFERCHVWAEEIDDLRRVARARLEAEAKNEFRDLSERIARLEQLLARTDSDMLGDQVDALRASRGADHRAME